MSNMDVEMLKLPVEKDVAGNFPVANVYFTCDAVHF